MTCRSQRGRSSPQSPALSVPFPYRYLRATIRSWPSIVTGSFRPQVLTLVQALQATTPVGAKVLDLGGYIGGFGIAAATAGYQVVIVEANPHNAACIRESLEANHFAHPVRLIEGAIGAESRDSVSFVSNGPWGHVSTLALGGCGDGGVRMYTLPELLATEAMDRACVCQDGCRRQRTSGGHRCAAVVRGRPSPDDPL